MDSLNETCQPRASHHQTKVVSNSKSGTQNIKTLSSVNIKNNPENKDTNFEYDDNEWDIGIGDLIIDLDADIEKSSTAHKDNFVIPINNPADSLHSTQEYKINTKLQNNQQQKVLSQNTVGLSNTTWNETDEKFQNNSDIKIDNTMSSSTNSNNKSSTKLSIDHQATLDKGLKMKIKRTKTGTKSSEAKHEIVKAEQNGATTSSDEGNSVLVNKKHSQLTTSPMSANANSASLSSKRGVSSHKKEKVKEKTPHSQREKTEISAPTVSVDKSCSCGSEILNNSDTACSNCGKIRDVSTCQRLASNQIINATSNDKQNISNSASSLKAPTLQNPLNNSTKNNINSQSGSDVEKTLNSITTPALAVVGSPKLVTISDPSNSNEEKNSNSPPTKRVKCDSKDMIDVCVGTSVGTITEPDCLGPCEPGTSVTLEGIVWHETEGGVLAVNVTWRGKTYVGTLIDCTKHDWAPPRFCDSPTEDLDSRTPKSGRGKRGRSAITPDLSNFTETRSSVHSKLRNGGKGRASRNTSNVTNTTSTNSSSFSGLVSTNTPSTSPTPTTAFLVPRPEKRKSKDESPSPVNGSNTVTSVQNFNATSGCNTQISSKKLKTVASPCAISPVLLECPEQDCSKKYKHANGLKYHQSHAHGILSSIDEDSTQAPESPQRADRSQTPPTSIQSITITNPTVTTVNNSVFNSFSNTQLNSDSANSTSSSSFLSNNSDSKVTVKASMPMSVDAPTTPLTFVKLNDHDKSSNTTVTTSSIPSLIPSVMPGTFTDSVQQQAMPNNTTTTPIRAESKPKPVGPRFGSLSDTLPPTVRQNPTLSDQLSGIIDYPSSIQQATNNLNTKPQSKQKKNRKSPAPNDFDNSIVSRAEDVRSPAYSDISDDSTSVVDSELLDKSKLTQLNDTKKAQESSSSAITLGNYSMYNSFYQQNPFYSPENQASKVQIPSATAADFNKGKEPPLDLMNKIQPPPEAQPKESGNIAGQNTIAAPPGKIMQHYPHYPYNYMQPSYSYNMDPGFGQLSIVPDDSKMALGHNIKEEQRTKENPIPSENLKINQQMTPLPKVVKSEPIKDIKLENVSQTKESQSPLQSQQQNLSPYSGFYPRHALSLPTISREEEIRRYYIYPDPPRRASSGHNIVNSATNLSGKDEQLHPTTSSTQHSSNNQKQLSTQHSSKSGKNSSSGTSQPHQKSNSSNQNKEIKIEDKDIKVKQEGQKPTMETQGPPPPPTSQYYLHPPYMYDPLMYRNMGSMPPNSYNPSYPLPMARFSTPEDLSRNPNPKALDLLQHHANQYYNTHKIHELSERARQSPTNNVIVSVSNPVVPQQQGPIGSSANLSNNQASNSTAINTTQISSSNNGNQTSIPNTLPITTTNLQQQAKGNDKIDRDPTNVKDGPGGRSPPPQRHVHTHHHTHVGLGYPGLYSAGYPAAVLASQQAAAVAVIGSNPFTNPPANK